MRKILTFTLFFLLVVMMSMQAFGADALYRMLHADEVESFKADQTAFIVARLIETKDEKITAEVMKVISGTVKSQNVITIDKFKYPWTDPEVTPAADDYCVLSLKKTGSGYKVAWGAYRADSGDYKTLKLINENIISQGLRTELGCIEWYVNSGGTENDFFFQGSNAYVKKANGEAVQINVGETLRNTSEVSAAAVLKQYETPTPQVERETEKTETAASEESVLSPKNTVIGLIVVTLVILIIGIIIINKNKRTVR